MGLTTETKRIIIIVLFIILSIIFATMPNRKYRQVNTKKKSAKTTADKKYDGLWEDLDQRPTPSWYRKAKIGVLVHMGNFAADVYLNQAEDNETLLLCDYNMERNYQLRHPYDDNSTMITGELFDADDWIKQFKDAGIRYVIFSSKRSDGYALFASKNALRNSVDTRPHRDFVGELAEAAKAARLKFGVYYTLVEWFHPLFEKDRQSQYATDEYVTKKMIPEIQQLVTDYQPSIFWSNGYIFVGSEYWRTTSIIKWLVNESPTRKDIVINDRWGIDTRWLHGGVYSVEMRTSEMHFFSGYLTKYKDKLEYIISLDFESWDYRHNADLGQIYDIKDLLCDIVWAITKGGNILLTFGVTKEGAIPVIYEERLEQLGKWLRVNGEAVYDSEACEGTKDYFNSDLYYACVDSTVYAFFGKWPKNNRLIVSNMAQRVLSLTCITLLGHGGCLEYKKRDNFYMEVQLPDFALIDVEHVWTIKFEKVSRTSDLSFLQSQF